jgi:hypothetical protein
MNSTVPENVPRSVEPVSPINIIALVLVFHLPPAGKVEVGGSTATRPWMLNISKVWLALLGDS